MGVSPKVQPIYAGFQKPLGYTVLMGLPPKVQTIYIGAHKTLGYIAIMGVSPKEHPIYAGSQKNAGLHCTKMIWKYGQIRLLCSLCPD